MILFDKKTKIKKENNKRKIKTKLKDKLKNNN